VVQQFRPDQANPDDGKQDQREGQREEAGQGSDTRHSQFEGFSDPSGQFPRAEYHFHSSLNAQAVGRHKHKLSLGGGDDDLDLTALLGDTEYEATSQYSRVQVQETQSGHVIVLDDTPGGETVLFKHRSGSGIEMRPDGTIVLRTMNHLVTSVGGTGAIIIEGDVNLSAQNVRLDASGDMNIKVGGDLTYNVGGDIKINADGSYRESIGVNKGSIVKGNNSSAVLGTTTDTILGNENHIVKGNYNNSIEGTNIVASKGIMRTSSQSEINVSAPSTNIAAADLAVFGSSGTIGGKEVVMYADNIHATDRITSDASMHAITFHGSLAGKAAFAAAADQAAVAPPGAGAGGGTLVDSSGVLKITEQPTADILSEYLTKSTRGIKKVTIDTGDLLKQKMDLSTDTGGKSKRIPTIDEARAQLMEEKTVNDAKYVATLAKWEVIDDGYAKAVPPGIGRSNSGGGSVSHAPRDKQVGNAIGQNRDKYVSGDRAAAPLSPPSRYFADALVDSGPLSINSQTLVGPSITIGTFLGGRGNKSTLNHVATFKERQDIARYLSLQAEIIKLVRNDTGRFEDFRIKVHTGIYKPGPGEELTEGGILDLHRTGRAVTYRLVDEKNEDYPEVTYDFAEYLAEYIFTFDTIRLSYDQFDPDSDRIFSRVTFVLPEIGPNYEASTASGKLETFYNIKKLSGSDLIEVMYV